MNRHRSVRVARVLVAVSVLTITACGGGDDEGAAEATPSPATVQPAPAATDAPAAPAAPAATEGEPMVTTPSTEMTGGGTATMMSSEALCALVTPAELEAQFGVPFDAGTPTGSTADFPACRWNQADDPLGALLTVQICCTGMGGGAVSLVPGDAPELAPGIRGLVRTDDIKMAQLDAYLNDTYFMATLDGVGPVNDLGMASPGEAELDQLVAFIQSFAERV
jgi:hypothetical protein